MTIRSRVVISGNLSARDASFTVENCKANNNIHKKLQYYCRDVYSVMVYTTKILYLHVLLLIHRSRWHSKLIKNISQILFNIMR